MTNTFRTILLAVMLLLGGSQTGYAQDLDKGWEAYFRGDYAAALKEWRPLAEQGDASAQTSLGNMYSNGQGVIKDYKEAVRLYRLAAEQGNAGAQTNLGYMYSEGLGVIKDHKEAVRWYRLAAEQGIARAQSLLGLMYADGRGVILDNVTAHMWYNIAASNGVKISAFARDNLAWKMTPADISEAQRLARECVRKEYKGC